jgi:hypothetical protein
MKPAAATRDSATGSMTWRSAGSRSTNAIDSLNARYRRTIKARGHFPTEQAAMKSPLPCDPIPRPDRCRQGTMDDAVETSAQRVCDHLRRPIPGSRNLLMETAGNTVSEIVPGVLAQIRRATRYRLVGWRVPAPRPAPAGSLQFAVCGVWGRAWERELSEVDGTRATA